MLFDAVEHLDKSVKSLFFILNQRVFLSVGAEIYPGFQVIEQIQVLPPALIDHSHHDLLYQEIPTLFTEFLTFELIKLVDQLYKLKCEEFGEERRDFLIQQIMMRVIDESWREHLYLLDHLKAGINFRAYGQKDPLVEYKKEAFDAFIEMLNRVKEQIASLFFKAQFIDESEMQQQKQQEKLAVHHATVSAFSGDDQPAQQLDTGPQKVKTVRREHPKIGRNDPCWCGSGKKFKHCHGKS